MLLVLFEWSSLKNKRMMNRIVLFLLVGVSVFISCKHKPNNHNLIVVVTDGILADSLACYGDKNQLTPNLDDFSKEAILFSNCFSNTSQRGPFMGMVLSGQHPLYNGAFSDHLPMMPLKGKRMAGVLQGNGYNTAFIGKCLSSDSQNDGFSNLSFRYGFRTFLPSVGDMSWEVKKTITHLDSVAKLNKPFALYVSLSGKKQNIRDGSDLKIEKGENESISEENSTEHSYLQDVDSAFKMIMDKVKDLGIDENTIVMFTSAPYNLECEHNNSLGQFSIKSLRRIPFLLKLPYLDLDERNSELLFGSLDMMSTTLGLLGLRSPKEVHGRNLAKAILNSEGSTTVSIPWFDFFPYASRGIITKEYSYAFQLDSGKTEGVLISNAPNASADVNLFKVEAFNRLKLDLELKTVQWMDYYEDEGYTAEDILEVMPIDDWQFQLQNEDTAERPIDALKKLHGKRIMHFHGNNNYDE